MSDIVQWFIAWSESHRSEYTKLLDRKGNADMIMDTGMLASVCNIVTSYCFDRIKVEMQASSTLTVQHQDMKCYTDATSDRLEIAMSICRKSDYVVLASDADDVGMSKVVRLSYDMRAGVRSVSCTCQRGPVTGIPCRHILCAGMFFIHTSYLHVN